MLPSLGCFSSLECPFYNGGAGQCSRPYCHYRHVKRDPNAPPEPAEDILGPVPYIVSQQPEDENKTDSCNETSTKSRTQMLRAIVDAAPAYNPTPIAQLRSSHIPIPYTPTIPTRSCAVKKTKPSSEYVPHHVGDSRPSYPPYCPSSISSLNSQSHATVDPLKNPLFEIYGPEGAQYSPNDVEPISTSYSYAPESASYAPTNTSYAPYSPEYVPSKISYNSQYSTQDSQLSDDDDNVDLALETAAQTNGVSNAGESLLDLDLSELDNLELEFEDDENQDDSAGMDCEYEANFSCGSDKVEDANHVEPERIEKELQKSQKGEKRRSSSSSRSNSKKHKVSDDMNVKNKKTHEDSDKNGLKSKKSSGSSSSSSRKDSSSSHRKSSSHSSSKSRSSSSSTSKSSRSPNREGKSTSSNKIKEGETHPKDKSGSSNSTSSSSKHKERHKEKERSKDREKEKHHSREKEKSHSKSKHSKKSSRRSSDEKEKQEMARERIEEEMRMLEVELDASLEDEDMIAQQCYEMFSEYSETLQNQPPVSNTEDQRVTVSEEVVPAASSKKRIAHQASHSSSQPNPKPVATLAKKSSPYQVMRDRWELLKKEKLQLLQMKESLAVAPTAVPKPAVPAPYSSTTSSSASLPISGKKRIAGVANVAKLLKPPISSSMPPTSSTSGTSATSETLPDRFYNKSSQRIDEFGRLIKVRVAHTPNMDAPVMRKPVVNPSDCRKFKVATRQANVNKLYQAYLDAGFGDASHDMALDSERTSTQGTESLGVYSHRIIQILKDLRACAESAQNGPKLDGMSGVPNRVVSHSAMLAGKLGAKVSWSIESSKKEADAKQQLSLYEQLKKFILTKEQLEENGFPMPSPEKGCASIKPSSYRVIQQPSDPRQKVCVRCLKPYSINKRGEQVKDEECFYHWGRKLTTRQYRQAETKYTCCDGTGGGCSVAPYHVFEQNWEKTTGFMSTLSKPRMESNPGVFALDCEMCYTTAGLELTRVTVIKEDRSVVYETLVKPSHKILDYNTRYSGITEEDLKNVTTTILQVQATLLGMFCDKTILIGHSLESDLKALKLIHPTVVDTSVVFPHKMGPPQKRALRNLAADYLKKIIQNDVGGHDSKEDAVAALDLMLWRLKEDEKTR